MTEESTYELTEELELKTGNLPVFVSYPAKI
jgi:hypothetical protein